MKLKNLLLTLLILILAAITLFLLMDFISAKEFSDLVPNADDLDACTIFCINMDSKQEVTLSGDKLTDFLSVLKKLQYTKRGSYGSVMEGTIYHICFTSPQEEPFTMIVSDTGKVYIGSNYYDFAPGISSDLISSYIEKILKEA